MNMTIYTDTSFTRPRETSLAQYGDEVLFASGPFAATERGLILPKAATFEEWQRAGLFFSTVGDAATWAMVDWLAWGEQQFGEESAQAFDEMDYSYGYILNLRTLYAAFPPHRRRWALGKSYYQAVLPLLPEAQEMILDAAVRRQMTRDEVRAEVRALPDTMRRRPRPARQTPQSMSPCSQCGDTLVRLASGADECPICEDICPTCSELRYGPDTPQTCSLDSDTRDLPTATTVIHLRDAPDGWRTDARYVYIGRASRRAGLPESKWHNPFPLRREDDRAAVIVQFSAYLDTRPDLLAALPELRGKILVCWCAPKACHGDVLAQRVNALPPDESALTSVFARHDRSACLEEREPAYAPVTRAGGLAATVETCYGRQVVLRFDVAPDLREGQAVRVMVEA